MRALAHGWKRSRWRRGKVGFFRKGIPMKRLVAFALITAIGMFVIGCGGERTPPPGKPTQGGFKSSGSGGTTPAAPAPADKK
jgi:hypothetical protein